MRSAVGSVEVACVLQRIAPHAVTDAPRGMLLAVQREHVRLPLNCYGVLPTAIMQLPALPNAIIVITPL